MPTRLTTSWFEGVLAARALPISESTSDTLLDVRGQCRESGIGASSRNPRLWAALTNWRCCTASSDRHVFVARSGAAKITPGSRWPPNRRFQANSHHFCRHLSGGERTGPFWAAAVSQRA
jgi:hypothetical protein